MTEDVIRGCLEGCDYSEILLPSVEGAYSDLPTTISPRLRERLGAQGIVKLYKHQEQAVSSLLSGKDTMLVTGTSSGKTLSYALPVLEFLSGEPMARALFLYPTKALAQDQLGKLNSLSGEDGPQAAVYDADTPKSHRPAIRSEAQMVLTNPDMLHVGILPSHELWRKFIRALRFIVIDEAHTLRGVFGSHCAWVIRRLLRLCDWYGSRPIIAAASATLPNPGQLFERLTGRKAHVVASDGAARGEKRIFLVSPPLTQEGERPFSPNLLTAQIMASLSLAKARSLAFCRSRIGTELVVRQARKVLESSGGQGSWVESYRGGYTPKERREVEKGFFKGKLRGVASTSAMELGVDVGGLDTVIINGYPGSLNSFWQQAGRSGRAGQSGAVVYIPHEDALEHHLLRHPETLFSSVEQAIISLDNKSIQEGQIPCAAFERPLWPSELTDITPTSIASAESLIEAGQLAFSAQRYFYGSYSPPAGRVSIRGSSSSQVTLICGSEEVGEMEDWRALSSVFPGAVYLHREKCYLTAELNWSQKTARLEEASPDYYTLAIVQTLAEERNSLGSAMVGECKASLASLEVTTRTVGYRKLSMNGGAVLEEDELTMPAFTYTTIGVIWDIPSDWAPLDDDTSAGVLHGLEHVLAGSAPLLAGCDPRDIQSSWFQFAPETLAPRIIIFDATPGGIGLSESLFGRLEEWAKTSLSILSGCPCEDGCPRCLMSSKCESGNQPLHKGGLIQLLKRLTGEMIC